SWQVIDGRERPFLLDVKWKEAKDSIETRCRSLREGAAAGRKLNSEAKALTDHIAVFRESLQEVRDALRDAKPLAHVESTGCRRVPRVYASLASYFRAVNYEFNEQTFAQFFSAVQEIAAFEM